MAEMLNVIMKDRQTERERRENQITGERVCGYMCVYINYNTDAHPE